MPTYQRDSVHGEMDHDICEIVICGPLLCTARGKKLAALKSTHKMFSSPEKASQALDALVKKLESQGYRMVDEQEAQLGQSTANMPERDWLKDRDLYLRSFFSEKGLDITALPIDLDRVLEALCEFFDKPVVGQRSCWVSAFLLSPGLGRVIVRERGAKINGTGICIDIKLQSGDEIEYETRSPRADLRYVLGAFRKRPQWQAFMRSEILSIEILESSSRAPKRVTAFVDSPNADPNEDESVEELRDLKFPQDLYGKS